VEDCWYKIHLKKPDGKNEWNIGFCDILALNPRGAGYISLAYQKRQLLVNNFLYYNKFRLAFLFE
jgi:hypothetical protein